MLGLLSSEEIKGDYVLSKIIRYNHRCRLQDESVAEHSFYVTLFCLRIMGKLQIDKETERQTLILATLHDAAESLTSDIPHDVKKRYPAMREMLTQIEDEYFRDNWNPYADILNNPTDLSILIVKLADAYSVYQFCSNENELGNNSSEMIKIKKESMGRIKSFTEQINDMLWHITEG